MNALAMAMLPRKIILAHPTSKSNTAFLLLWRVSASMHLFGSRFVLAMLLINRTSAPVPLAAHN
jgi:hypothetical protein